MPKSRACVRLYMHAYVYTCVHMFIHACICLYAYIMWGLCVLINSQYFMHIIDVIQN